MFADTLVVEDTADTVHSSLWNASRRIGVRIFEIEEPGKNKYEVVKWEQ